MRTWWAASPCSVSELTLRTIGHSPAGPQRVHAHRGAQGRLPLPQQLCPVLQHLHMRWSNSFSSSSSLAIQWKIIFATMGMNKCERLFIMSRFNNLKWNRITFGSLAAWGLYLLLIIFLAFLSLNVSRLSLTEFDIWTWLLDSLSWNTSTMVT